MSDPHNSAADEEPKYRIGAACRLTGLSQHVLRVWEKRYGVVEPARSMMDRALAPVIELENLSTLPNPWIGD